MNKNITNGNKGWRRSVIGWPRTMAREQTIVLYFFLRKKWKINMSVCVCVWNNRLFRSCQNLWGKKPWKKNKPTWMICGSDWKRDSHSNVLIPFRWEKKDYKKNRKSIPPSAAWLFKRRRSVPQEEVVFISSHHPTGIFRRKKIKTFEFLWTAPVTTTIRSLWGHFVSQLLHNKSFFTVKG